MAPFDRSYTTFYWSAIVSIALKTRMVWLPDGEKTLIICLAVSTEYRRVTDGRTDRRTDRDGRTDIFPRHSPRYMHTRRAIKIG